MKATTSVGCLTVLAAALCCLLVHVPEHEAVDSTSHSWFLAQYAANGLKSFRAKCAAVQDEERYDCHPDSPSSEMECISRGCCWMPATNPQPHNDFDPIGVPYCFFPKEYSGYNIYKTEHSAHTTSLYLKRMINSGFVNEVPDVRVDLIHVNRHQARVRVLSSSERRFQVPIALNVSTQTQVHDVLYRFNVSDGVLMVIRKETDTVVWSANLNTLIYADQMLQINTRLPTDIIYGLGEHKDEFRKSLDKWKRYVFLNWDQPPAKNAPLYGTHPVYFAFERTPNAPVRSHSVFLFNSNAMETVLQPKKAITWRSIGGVLDFYINFGPTMEETVQQYVNLVGRPQIPPYWSLGFHLCRYGYKTLNNTRQVVNRMLEAGIPYDVQWHDIDFMKDYNVFTYDHEKFDGLPEFIDELHSKHMKYIPMFDPGLGGGHSVQEYPIYYEALEQGLFIKNISDQVLRSRVWNVHWTAWLDFTNPKTVNFWVKQFRRFHREVQFDGAWIVMNEPSGFVDGSLDGCPDTPYDKPQYVPMLFFPLRKNTACMSAQHHLGLHYDLHNLYGYFEAIATDKALKSMNKRPFILSRSTFAGQGQYSAHWTGDVLSTWEDLRQSIHDMLSFNLFGIPMVGADICGFLGTPNEELCTRWQLLGSFYPFSRNHNEDNQADQDPAALGDNVLNATKKALRIRYSLLPLLYTEFYKSHETGSPVIRSMPFEFWQDPQAENVWSQFLWGHSVMIAPVVDPNQFKLDVYFPAGTWYRYNTLKELCRKPVDQNVGHTIHMDVPLTDIVVAVRGGSILATQQPEITTFLTRQNPFRLLIALDERQFASGDLYWDDGEVVDPILIGEFNYVEFTFQNNQLVNTVKYDGYDQQPPVQVIEIVGLNQAPDQVFVDGTNVSFVFDTQNKLLQVPDVSLNVIKPFQVHLHYNQ